MAKEIESLDVLFLVNEGLELLKKAQGGPLRKLASDVKIVKIDADNDNDSGETILTLELDGKAKEFIIKSSSIEEHEEEEEDGE